MADRVSATITIGGSISDTLLSDFVAIAAAEGLSTEWDGPSFVESDMPDGEMLRLMAHEVAWGRFEELEAFCQANALPFARWSGSYGGEWGAERVVFTGCGAPVSYIADDEDRILLDHATIERLATLDAIRDHFAAADYPIPPLRVSPSCNSVCSAEDRRSHGRDQ